jgi:site-specific DNA recombinase
MVKNPSTGKRLSRVNPESEWQTIDVPHLRIVEQNLFDKVATRLESVGGSQAKSASRSKRVLSGLLKCGCCNDGMSIVGKDRSGPRVQCSVNKESGSCENGARYYIEKIERLVVDALRVQLAKPDLI